jgi:molybdate transport system ATP-binding protein
MITDTRVKLASSAASNTLPRSQDRGMLEVHISLKRGNFELELGFHLSECGIAVIFGPSGSGKTSLINCIAGLETPDAGRIVCHGQTCFDADHGINLPPEKRRLGYVFQDARLFPHLSVRENLCFGQRFHPVPPSLTAPGIDDVADLLDIGPLLYRPPANLSGGEKQRVAIGRALLCRPRLMLMDEPLSSLDMNLKEGLLSYITRIPRQWHVPVLYVTHSPEETRTLGNSMLLLRHGHLEAQGPVDTTLRKARQMGLLPCSTLSLSGAPHEAPCPA